QRRIEVSVRPAWVARDELRVGHAAQRFELKGLRKLYEERAQRQVAASASPFVAVDGLAAFLRDYPYACTEQIVSAGIPALVAGRHPEFGLLPAADAKKATATTLGTLRARQNSEGGIGTWLATPEVDPFVSAYAALYLVEAGERGQAVPRDAIDGANRYLRGMAADRSLTSLAQLRARALAVYLLVRQGQNAGNLLAGVREQLDRDHPKTWPQDDATAMLLASSYALLQQDAAARPLVDAALRRANAATPAQATGFAGYYDAGIARGWNLYLLHRHFPERAAKLPPAAIERLLAPMRENTYNTLSSALAILALEAYGAAQDPVPPPGIEAVGADHRARAIGEATGLLRRATVSAGHRSLRLVPTAGVTAWYALAQKGFDLEPGPAVQDQGLEVVRDYLDAEGKPVTGVALGAEVTVRLRVRALGADARGNVAIVDLLPGGFETVMQLP